MNFFEAMEALESGRVVESCLGHRYEFFDGKFRYTDGGDDDEGIHFSGREISGKWKIIEPEKKKIKKWLWAHLNLLDNNWVPFLRFLSEKEAESFFEGRKHQKFGDQFIEVEE